jgi:hypothetical protein
MQAGQSICARFRCRNSVRLKLAVAAVLLGAAATAQSVSIRLDDGRFRVEGWKASSPTDLSSIFQVFAGEGEVPPMLGSYTVEGDSIVFRPQFPLVSGIRYRAVFAPPSATELERIFDGPAKKSVPGPATRVERIYPSADVLPANQLKLYIYFSAPMSRGDAYRHIHLLDEAGQPVPLAFVEIDQELWDPSYQRLTVLFDPGRIKRGLVPQQELGTPIVEGKKYTLMIDPQWRDARGGSLAAEFRKPFRGGPVDRTPPDPKEWRVTAPKAGTSEALTVEFPDSMDYALLQRMIDVAGVTGRVTVDRNETEWLFTPDHPWKAGDYRMVVDTALEDLAGNRVGRAFDVDTLQPASHLASAKTVTLPFSVR